MNRLSEEEVKRMVEEAEEYAEQDKAVRLMLHLTLLLQPLQ